MKTSFLLSLFAVGLLASVDAAAQKFYSLSPREEINLAGKDWQEAVADTLDMSKLPEGLSWRADADILKDSVDTRKVNSASPLWSYGLANPQDYFEKDGSLKTKSKLVLWFKREVDVPAGLLEGHEAFLHVAGVGYRSALIVNGQLAGESIQSAVPLDFAVTKFLKPGKNEIALGVSSREGLLDLKAQVYLAPNEAPFGVRGPLRLEFKPKVFVDDVFVKTSVSGKSIDFQTTVLNSSSEARTLLPEIRVLSRRDPLQVVASFKGEPFKAAPGVETVFNVKKSWIAPILWSLTTPEMYVAQVSLYDGDSLVDSFSQPFGFREFTTKGKDFLLNGNRVVLIRNSSLNGLTTLELQPAENSVLENIPGVNCFRQHLGSYNANLIYLANQRGLMVVPEAAYSWTDKFPHDPEKVKVWLPGVVDYYKRWAKLLRNEPSVVMYSVVNETYWSRNLPAEMAVAKKIAETMREADPTRPLQGDGELCWNGLLDVINIHYPEGAAGTLSVKYPNALKTFPNDLEWLKPEGGKGWQCDFVWDRPLVIGEFGGFETGIDASSSYAGDAAYDWVKWEKLRRSSRDPGSSSPLIGNRVMDVFRSMIDFYRAAGVAGLNPWTGDFADVLKAQSVAPLDFHPNVDAGGVLKRKLAVFNDGVTPVHKIHCYLTVDGKLLSDFVKPFYLAPGQKWIGEIETPVPDVAAPTKGELLVRLMRTIGQEDHEVARHKEIVYIVPKVFDESAFVKSVAVVDPSGSLNALLASLKLDGAERISGESVPEGKLLVVIAADAFKPEMRKALEKFVADGGCALMLPQKNWKPFLLELPERDVLHAATQAWIRAKGHPAFKGMEEPQFSYWNKDNVVSFETFKKPSQGRFLPLLDAGGRTGLAWTPLVEIPSGKGVYIMSSLELDKGEPAARQLLANLVDCCCVRMAASPTERLNLLAGNNAALVEALEMTNVELSDGIGSEGPILVDGSASFDVKDLQKALDQGRTVWLRNFTPETLPKVASLLPPGAKLAPVPKGLLGAMLLSPDALTAGLASYDLAWYLPELYYGGPLFHNATVSAKTGDWLLDCNLFAKDVVPLSEPSFLVKLKSGNGTILFDTLQWESAVGKETAKALRVASLLSSNMGCAFKTAKKVNYKCSFADLAKFANMGYMDGVADDGVGGWSDQGRNDMRFFLINHSGKGNGEADGMDVPVPPFPTDVEFNGVPFRLIDPKANGGKAVLSFGSEQHASKLMRQAQGIPVGAKADKLWLLHATAWAPGQAGSSVAKIRVDYEDGKSVEIPIRSEFDVGDWHNPHPLKNAEVAWSGRNLVVPSVGVYMSSWKNPRPDKTIKSVSVEAGIGEGQYLLLAVTLGVAEKDASVSEDKVLSEMDFVNGRVDQALFFKTEKPAVQTEEGMLFEHGSELVINARKAGLADWLKEPFSVEFEFTPTAKPDGYCAGLIEPSSFRITLGGNMKVCVETFDRDGKRLYISSREPVEFGKSVVFKYSCDGKRGTLWRDGKIDVVSNAAALPGHECERVRLGVAGGKDYNFNGSFQRVEFAALAVPGK